MEILKFMDGMMPGLGSRIKICLAGREGRYIYGRP